MRMLTVAAGAAFLILAASPAQAGGPTRGGHPGAGHPGGGCGSCGGGGGGHPGGGHPGGGYAGGANINVNVNASANANAYAGASAGSYLNARTYNVSGARGVVGGGAVYVGGGYGGDGGGPWSGPVYYNEAVYEGRACGAAPFGYVLSGFGRNQRAAPVCGGGYEQQGDRGGRYGYSERHESRYEESRYESREAYAVYEGRTAYAADDGHREERYEDRGQGYGAHGAVGYGRSDTGGRHNCGCRADVRDAEPYIALPEPAPYVPAPEPVYEAPMTPNQYYGTGGQTPPPPRQHYSQEPGERG
ncbi:hypothetical protein [Brevundimonas sp. TWP2-3-4b2]|uniref:hypothetical protein n=1 Tax=Brevundimonas sp. TWP2-3-4b2 TaxID=2804595 RepID=UPI003CF4B174